MKLIYITGKKFPSKKTDPFYVRSMATAFAKLLKEDVTFVVRATDLKDLPGIPVLSIPAPEHLRSLFYFLYLPYLIYSRGWNKKEVVCLSYDPNILSVLIFWRRLLRLRYRVASDWHQLFSNWRDAYVARGSDYLTTTSKRLKDFLVARTGVEEGKIKVAYGGVDPTPFLGSKSPAQLRTGLGLPEGLLVGYVGTFSAIGHKKGINTMLEALKYLPKHARCVLVGGAPQEIKEYTALASTLGVQDRAVFVPKQPFAKVVEYERAFDVLVIPYPDLPHFRDWGFPMKVWEYLAAGRPIVYSNLAIIGEVLQGKATPFEPGNPQSLAEAALRAYNDPRAATNPKAVEQYTWVARATNILNFINH